MNTTATQTQTFTVTFWNTFSVKGDGVQVMSGPVQAATISEALEKASRAAAMTNELIEDMEPEQREPLRINYLSCKGFVRVIY